MSHKRSKWKFSPARRRRPSGKLSGQMTAADVQEEQLELQAEEPVVPEPEPEIIPEPEPEIISEPEPEIVPEPEIIPEPEPEIIPEPEEYDAGLPDYFFDEEDEIEDIASDEAEDEAGYEAGVRFEDGRAAEEAEVDFGEELSDEFFETEEPADEESADEEPADEEPRPSLYEWGLTGNKQGKKKNKKGKKGKEKKPAVKSVRIGDLIVGDGTPKICVPITGRSKDLILKQAAEIAAAAPDMAEWRVDYLEEAGGKKDIVDILVGLRRVLGDIPLLFTYRTEGEGGNGRVGWSHYAELLEWAACRPEIDAIDVEAMGLDVDTEGLIRVIRGRGTPVIASVHYCGEMPGKKERKEAIRFLKQSGGDIIKMAVTPQNEEDVLDFMKWTWKQSRKMEQPLITMAMGDLGKVSRISGALTGSAVTFGSVGEASASGQIPAAELRKILKHI